MTVGCLPGNASAGETIPRHLCQLLQDEEGVFQMVECSKKEDDIVFLAGKIDVSIQIN